jgi:hypothetical protein
MESCQPNKRLKYKKKISYLFLRSLHAPLAVMPGNRTQPLSKHTTAIFVVGTNCNELKTGTRSWRHSLSYLQHPHPPSFFLFCVSKVAVAGRPPAMFQFVTVCTIRYVSIKWTCNPLTLIKQKCLQLLTGNTCNCLQIFALSDEETEHFSLSDVGIQAVILTVTVTEQLHAKCRRFVPSICFTMRCTLSKNFKHNDEHQTGRLNDKLFVLSRCAWSYQHNALATQQLRN